MSKLTIEDAKRTWEAAAPGWARWEEVFAAGFEGATATMLDMAHVTAGTRLLDLACGAGSQTFLAAERVGEGATLTACDISETMLAHVREKAHALGLSNIETLACAAEELDPSHHRFDAAICRLGLMLFPDPVRAATAVRSSLSSGGRFAALVFTTPAGNPFMAGPMGILLRHAGREPPPPGSPGIFALGAAGALESVMTRSGFSDIETRLVRPVLRLPSTDAALAMMQSAFGAYRAVVAGLTDDARNAAWSEVADFLARFESERGWETELEAVVGSGVASG